MRIPVSGVSGALPKFHEYDYRVEHGRYRPVFALDKAGNYGDTFFDLGKARPVITSVASNGVDTMWVWAPTASGSTQYPDKVITDSYLRVGHATQVYTEATSNLVMTLNNRPDIYHDGTRYIVGAANGTSIKVYDGPSLLNGIVTQINSVEYAGITGHTGLSVLGENDLWISWVSNGIMKIKQYKNGTWSEHVLSSSPTLESWHATGTRVVLYNGVYYIFYQESANRAVVRRLEGKQLSESMSVLGADSEYAFQASMVSGAIVLNNRIFVTLVRGVEGAEGIPTAWFSSVFYSVGDKYFCDWSGITGYSFRGGVGKANNKLVAISTDYIYTSPDTTVSSSSAWQALDGVGEWSYETEANAASSGATELELNVGASYPSPGDLIRRYFTVDNAEYLYSTESVDTMPKSLTHVGLSGGMRSRGLLKHGITYRSTVDELYSSGGKRLIDFRHHSTVGKHGVWTHSTDTVPNRMTIEDDDGGNAISVLPEPVVGSVWFMLVAGDRFANAGPVFFYEDNDNYWRIRFNPNRYYLEQVSSGVATEIVSWDAPGTEEATFLVHITDNVIRFYTSSPESPSTPSNRHLNVSLTMTGIHTMSSAHPDRYYVGYYGQTGAYFSYMYLRRHGIDQTIGTIAESVLSKAGLELKVLPQLDAQPTQHDLTFGPLFFESNSLDKYDVSFNMNFSGFKVCDMYMGGPRALGESTVLASSWAYRVYLSPTLLRLYVSDDTNWNLISSMSLPFGYQIYSGDRVRISVTRSDDLSYSTLTVYVNDKLYWSTPMPSHMDTGHLAFDGTASISNVLVPGLSYPVTDYIWQYDRSARDAVVELIDPFFWVLIEQNDGIILAKPREMSLGHAGNVDSGTQLLDDNPVDEFYSVVRAEGAETYAVYVEPELIGRGVRYLNINSPYLYDEAACISQAYRIAKYWAKAINRSGFRSFLDPRLQLYDKVSVNNNDYVIESYSVQVSSTRKPNALITCASRRA